MATYYSRTGQTMAWNQAVWSASDFIYVPISGYPGPGDNVYIVSEVYLPAGFNASCYAIYHEFDTLNLNGQTLTTKSYFFVENSTSPQPLLAFGSTGKMILTGTNQTVLNISGTGLLNTSGSKNVELAFASTGIRTVLCTSSSVTSGETLNLSIGGTDQINMRGNFNNIDFTGFYGTLNLNGATNCYGNFTGATLMTTAASASTLSMAGTSGNRSLDIGASVINFPVTTSGNSNVDISSDILSNTSYGRFANTVTVNNATKTTKIVSPTTFGVIAHLSGNLASETSNVTLSTLSALGGTARTLSMGSASWILNGSSNWLVGPTNNTILPGTSTLVLAGSGATVECPQLNNVLIESSTNSYFYNDMTMNNLTSAVIGNSTVRFMAGKTFSFGSFDVSGIGGTVTIDTQNAGVSNLVKTAPGFVISKNVIISDSNASPSDTWYATVNATDASNNTGWIFGTAGWNSYFLAW